MLHTSCALLEKKTHNSSWVRWEIKKAVDLNRRIVAVKTKSTNTTSNELYGAGATWAMSFTEAGVISAVNSA